MNTMHAPGYARPQFGHAAAGAPQRPRTKPFRDFFADRGWAAANGWTSMSKSQRRERGFFPNVVFCHMGIREVMIPLLIKPAPEHAATLGVVILEHYHRRVQETTQAELDAGQGVRQAWVALAHRDSNVYIGSTTIEMIWRAVQGVAPNRSHDPTMPDYFWIDANCEASTFDMWRARQEDFVL